LAYGLTLVQHVMPLSYARHSVSGYLACSLKVGRL